jgi:SAM-dependent methyltransferase
LTVRRLDIGCGPKRRPGFIGTDRFPMPGVSVVADLDAAGLPFADDSFDLIFACHSLEHIEDLPFVMSEVWRVGKPGAQVCILAPYYTQAVNFANPYHKQVFNEHTPRFWTASPRTRIDPAEFADHPHAPQWGLSQSDNSRPGFDLRCLRMDFLYFREYRSLSPEEQRRARKKYLDVCDQMVYYLAVFKPPMTEDDLDRLEMDFYDSPEMIERRRVERLQEAEDRARLAASVPAPALPPRRSWLGRLLGREER